MSCCAASTIPNSDARQLAELLRGIPSKVNVIPFNPHPGSVYFAAGGRAILCVSKTFCTMHGVQVNVRRPRGDDIQAACGQLQGEELRAVRGAENALLQKRV